MILDKMSDMPNSDNPEQTHNKSSYIADAPVPVPALVTVPAPVGLPVTAPALVPVLPALAQYTMDDYYNTLLSNTHEHGKPLHSRAMEDEEINNNFADLPNLKLDPITQRFQKKNPLKRDTQRYSCLKRYTFKSMVSCLPRSRIQIFALE